MLVEIGFCMGKQLTFYYFANLLDLDRVELTFSQNWYLHVGGNRFLHGKIVNVLFILLIYWILAESSWLFLNCTKRKLTYLIASLEQRCRRGHGQCSMSRESHNILLIHWRDRRKRNVLLLIHWKIWSSSVFGFYLSFMKSSAGVPEAHTVLITNLLPNEARYWFDLLWTVDCEKNGRREKRPLLV